MFGYMQSTEIARQLELIFDDPAVPDPDRLAELALKLRQSLKL